MERAEDWVHDEHPDRTDTGAFREDSLSGSLRREEDGEMIRRPLGRRLREEEVEQSCVMILHLDGPER